MGKALTRPFPPFSFPGACGVGPGGGVRCAGGARLGACPGDARPPGCPRGRLNAQWPAACAHAHGQVLPGASTACAIASSTASMRKWDSGRAAGRSIHPSPRRRSRTTTRIRPERDTRRYHVRPCSASKSGAGPRHSGVMSVLGHAGLSPRVARVRVASRAWWRQAAAGSLGSSPAAGSMAGGPFIYHGQATLAPICLTGPAATAKFRPCITTPLS
jgi:hypothetical protein